jgi:hypothetical protein
MARGWQSALAAPGDVAEFVSEAAVPEEFAKDFDFGKASGSGSGMAAGSS